MQGSSGLGLAHSCKLASQHFPHHLHPSCPSLHARWNPKCQPPQIILSLPYAPPQHLSVAWLSSSHTHPDICVGMDPVYLYKPSQMCRFFKEDFLELPTVQYGLHTLPSASIIPHTYLFHFTLQKLFNLSVHPSSCSLQCEVLEDSSD